MGSYHRAWQVLFNDSSGQMVRRHSNPLPTTWDDEAWSGSQPMQRAKKFWSDPAREEKHLELQREYEFYDASF